MPPREVFLMAYLNEGVRPLFKPEWYWSSTEFGATNAWGRYFGSGSQGGYGKGDGLYVRVVKKGKI